MHIVFKIKSITCYIFSVTLNVNQHLPSVDSANMTPTKQTKILLFAYMKGGSTFVGQMLGHVPNVFYIYEPLMELAVDGYYSVDNVCSILQHKCR